jgi:type I restriction enzyme S subunit
MTEPLAILPQDWSKPSVGDLACHVGSGSTPRGGQEVYTKKGITFIRSQNVTFEGLRLDDVVFISQRTHEQMQRSEVFPNDVLLNITGASIGRCCPVPSDFVAANVNQHVCAIRLPKPTQEDAFFLSSVLASHIGQSQIDRLNAGGNREGLNFQQVRNFIVPWPKPQERIRIAEILDTLDAAIRETEAVVAKLRQVKAGLLHDLLTRGLDAHGRLRDPARHPEQFQDSPLGLTPCDWRVVTLGHILAEQGGFLQTGPFGSQLHSRDYSKEGVAVLMPQDIREDGSMDEAQAAKITEARTLLLARHRLRANDIVFARRGDLSRCCVVEAGKNAICGTGCILFRPPAKAVHSAWFAAIYRHDTCQRQIAARAVGTTMVNLNTELLTGLWLRFPGVDEQERIAERLTAFESRLNAEQDRRAKLQQLKHGLSHDLLTGHVRVVLEKES